VLTAIKMLLLSPVINRRMLGPRPRFERPPWWTCAAILRPQLRQSLMLTDRLGSPSRAAASRSGSDNRESVMAGAQQLTCIDLRGACMEDDFDEQFTTEVARSRQFTDIELDRRRKVIVLAAVSITVAVSVIGIILVTIFSINSSEDVVYSRLGAFIAPLVALSGAVIGFYFGARPDSERAVAPTRRKQAEVDLRAGVDIYSKGIAQLDSDRMIARIAGIRLLGVAATHDAQLRDAVAEVLAAFVRMSARLEVEDADDIRAALMMLGHAPFHSRGLDLSGARLRGLRLDDLDLSGVDLSYADLRECILDGSRLVGVNMRGANLQGCRALGANFSRAVLQEADMTGAVLVGANFYGALLSKTILDKTVLSSASFKGALVADTSFEDADTRGAEFPPELLAPVTPVAEPNPIAADGLDV
jgi:uncharacterized protein YjbI with pentapeptide repeats